jgi:uncharacterized protein (TIGR02246 family)
MFLHSVIAATVAAAPAAEAPQAAIISSFIRAWDAADAAGMARLFEPTGRLVIPSGMEVTGRTKIQQFYKAAFSGGYKGSKGGAKVARVTAFTPTLAMVEGDWSIDGAKKADGSPRAGEGGQFTAMLRRSAKAWRIVSLREMELTR